MDYNLEVKDISTPDGLLRLKTAIRELADECDTLYTETAPNGNISARQGRIAIYNNSGTYSIWVNQDGLLTWSEMTNQSIWEVDGTETQLKTADEIDMQSKKIINVLDPTSAQDASTKNYVDGKFDTSTGHDHDGVNSKQIDFSDILNNDVSYMDLSFTGAPVYVDSTAGDVLLHSLDTERTCTSASWVKIKSWKVSTQGTFRIKFEGYCNSLLNPYGKIYRNGVAVGTQRSLYGADYATVGVLSEDIAGWSVGDEVQLWAQTGGGTIYLKNFRIYDNHTTYGSQYDASG